MKGVRRCCAGIEREDHDGDGCERGDAGKRQRLRDEPSADDLCVCACYPDHVRSTQLQAKLLRTLLLTSGKAA